MGSTVPRGTPQDIIEKLNRRDQYWPCRCKDQGTHCGLRQCLDAAFSPPEFSKLLADRCRKSGRRMIRAARRRGQTEFHAPFQGGVCVKTPRRRFLRLDRGRCRSCRPNFARRRRAQAYPSRPLRWIVGFPPGGGADTVARIAGQWLSDRLGQARSVVETKQGGRSLISRPGGAVNSRHGNTLHLGWVSSGDQPRRSIHRCLRTSYAI